MAESLQLMRDQRVWSLKECAESFAACVTALKARLQQDNILYVDDFVLMKLTHLQALG